MRLLLKIMTPAIIAIGTLVLLTTTSASAHVVVKPSEVVTSGFQTFTIGVPNEKDIPTTTIKLVMPSGLKHVSPTQKAGWNINIARNGTEDDAAVTSITWRGNEINAGFRDDFTFSAQVPATVTDLQWRAYQTYADGTVVSWDSANTDGHETNSGPFSVTKVVSLSATDVALTTTEDTLTETQRAASSALYVGVAGVVVGLIAVYFSTRKRS